MLNDFEVSYAELTGNNIRSAEYEEQSRTRSRSNEGCQSIFFFGATMVSLRGDVADVGILMMSLKYDIATVTTTSCRKVAYVIGGIY